MKSAFLTRILGHADKIDKQQVVDYLVEVAEERDLFRLIFDSMLEGMVVIAPDFSISYVNHPAAERFNVDDIDKVIGQPAEQVIPYPWVIDMCRKSMENRKENLRQEVVFRQGGRDVYLEANVVPLRSGHEGMSLLFFFVDRTEERRKEERLRHAEKLAALTTLTAGVSHEIRNPLNSLSIHLQLLRRKLRRMKEQDSEILEILGVLQNEVKRLNNILGSFLSTARRGATSFVKLSPRAVITDTLALLKPDLEEEKIDVIVHEEGEIPSIMGDSIQLKQAFINVLQNAVDAINEASQTLLEEGREPGERRVTITLVRDEEHVNFVFTDTGAGILDSDIDRVFEPYYTTKEKGTGLGLMIVNRIVQEHRGEVNLRSRIGQGTQVIISLPAAPEEVRLLEHQEQPEEQPA